MDLPNDISELTKLFNTLGAQDSELWAKSQIREGIPQLQRYLFLRQAWRYVLQEDDGVWVDSQIQESERYPTGPYAGVGAALKRAVANGTSKQDLIDIARGAQAELLFQFCSLLDNAGFSEPELEGFAWGLFEVDENDNPISPRIGNLYESVLATDPTGREMRPRGSTNV